MNWNSQPIINLLVVIILIVILLLVISTIKETFLFFAFVSISILNLITVCIGVWRLATQKYYRHCCFCYDPIEVNMFDALYYTKSFSHLLCHSKHFPIVFDASFSPVVVQIKDKPKWLKSLMTLNLKISDIASRFGKAGY